MEPESELCEVAPTLIDSWAKLHNCVPSHLGEKLTDTAAPPPVLDEHNAMVLLDFPHHISYFMLQEVNTTYSTHACTMRIIQLHNDKVNVQTFVSNV